MTTSRREIGPLGTAARVLVGLGLLYLAGGANGLTWGVLWYDALVGLVVLPAIAVALGLAARRYAGGPVRLTGAVGIALNVAVIAALVSNPYTGAGAMLFYGATMLIAAWRGQAGCEATVISNLALGRDDQIGCPTLTPIDAVEAHLRCEAALARSAVAVDIDRPREGKFVTAEHDTPEQEGWRSSGSAPESRSVWGHSLPAAVVCVAAAATIVVVAIFGQSG